MCDFVEFLLELGAAQLLAAGAIVLIVAAIAKNASFFLALTAPAYVISAAVAIGTATGAVTLIWAKLGLPACSNPGCLAEISAAMAAGRFATAAGAAAAVLLALAKPLAAFPILGPLVLGAACAGIVVFEIALADLSFRLADLQRCIENTKGFVPADVLTVTGVVGVLLAIGFGLIAIGSSRNDPKPFGSSGG